MYSCKFLGNIYFEDMYIKQNKDKNPNDSWFIK